MNARARHIQMMSTDGLKIMISGGLKKVVVIPLWATDNWVLVSPRYYLSVKLILPALVDYSNG